MDEYQLEQFLNSVDSRHRAVVLAAKRAKQLQKGLRPYFEGKSTKVTVMALEELINKKVEMYIPEEVTDDTESETDPIETPKETETSE